jgi:plasmid stabilization system protein ParE
MSDREFLPLAEEEMNETARFYEERVRGLGREFLEEVERAINSILIQPSAGRIISQNIRRRILKRFPFGILYAMEPDRIVIVAVMHLHRRPGYWKSRIGAEF